MSESADVRTAYDAWAETYDAIDNPLIAQAAAVLDARAAWLGDARVLELGCGTGRNAAACFGHGARGYTGVDASPGMLAIARSRFTDPQIRSPSPRWIEAELCDGARAAARDTGFDLVLICLVLEHVRDIAPVIGAAADALAPGGHLLVLELHPALHGRGIGANFQAGGREVRLTSICHDAAELVTACAQAGLSGAIAVDHCPAPAALARSAKLARYTDQPVLIEVTASR
jgi:malonyl-CoA O-methyltransferase